jgi:hypothetical protein
MLEAPFNLRPSQITDTALVKGLCKNGDIGESFALLQPYLLPFQDQNQGERSKFRVNLTRYVFK